MSGSSDDDGKPMHQPQNVQPLNRSVSDFGEISKPQSISSNLDDVGQRANERLEDRGQSECNSDIAESTMPSSMEAWTRESDSEDGNTENIKARLK